MDVTIKIDCDNAAFDDDPGAEIADILTKLSHKLRANGLDHYISGGLNLRDRNGNGAGDMTIDTEKACEYCGSKRADLFRCCECARTGQ